MPWGYIPGHGVVLVQGLTVEFTIWQGLLTNFVTFCWLLIVKQMLKKTVNGTIISTSTAWSSACIECHDRDWMTPRCRCQADMPLADRTRRVSSGNVWLVDRFQMTETFASYCWRLISFHLFVFSITNLEETDYNNTFSWETGCQRSQRTGDELTWHPNNWLKTYN